ncbi:hypothetical protein BASA83_002036 [Batrachochytrium salamandrivorans]|nr:hypothetical protein BASA83_002036 [Batrachochytrium salamandrivorans]
MIPIWITTAKNRSNPLAQIEEYKNCQFDTKDFSFSMDLNTFLRALPWLLPFNGISDRHLTLHPPASPAIQGADTSTPEKPILFDGSAIFEINRLQSLSAPCAQANLSSNPAVPGQQLEFQMPVSNDQVKYPVSTEDLLSSDIGSNKIGVRSTTPSHSAYRLRISGGYLYQLRTLILEFICPQLPIPTLDNTHEKPAMGINKNTVLDSVVQDQSHLFFLDHEQILGPEFGTIRMASDVALGQDTIESLVFRFVGVNLVIHCETHPTRASAAEIRRAIQDWVLSPGCPEKISANLKQSEADVVETTNFQENSNARNGCWSRLVNTSELLQWQILNGSADVSISAINLVREYTAFNKFRRDISKCLAAQTQQKNNLATQLCRFKEGLKSEMDTSDESGDFLLSALQNIEDEANAMELAAFKTHSFGYF